VNTLKQPRFWENLSTNWDFSIMDRGPFVSIIILNHNYGAFVGRAIRSAVEQPYPNKEVIVVDDGSIDHSGKVIEAFNGYDGVRTIYKENGGQASAANAGFQISSGEIIIFLDADDYLMSDALHEIVRPFASTDVVKVHWPLRRTDEEGLESDKIVPEGKLAEGNLFQQVSELGPAHCGGPPESPPTSGNAWSRNFLSAVMPIPEFIFKGGIDQYLFVLTPVFGEIRSIPVPLGYYRVHGTNNTLKPDYRNTFFGRFEYCCHALSRHLAGKGIHKNPDEWPRDHWFHKVEASIKDIQTLIPESTPVILIDDDAWNAGRDIAGRERLYLLEKNGQSWGIPVDDSIAIDALEERKNQSAGFLVIVWSAFWWLQYFPVFWHFVRERYPLILENDRLLIFSLSGKDS
jgi:glycosyltransferase involved in cell wall biosynthesis